MPHRNLSRGGSHGALAFYSGAQRGSPKVAGTRRAAPRPFRRALSYQALEAVLRRGTVPAEDAGSDQSERPLGRDRAHAAANHRNLRPRHRQASELRGGVITSLRCIFRTQKRRLTEPCGRGGRITRFNRRMGTCRRLASRLGISRSARPVRTRGFAGCYCLYQPRSYRNRSHPTSHAAGNDFPE
jgi:hypothetical protein